MIEYLEIYRENCNTIVKEQFNVFFSRFTNAYIRRTKEGEKTKQTDIRSAFFGGVAVQCSCGYHNVDEPECCDCGDHYRDGK